MYLFVLYMAFCWVFDLLAENCRQTANPIVNSKFEFQAKLRLRIQIWAKFEENVKEFAPF